MPNPVTVSDALLHYLSLEKVDHVFGIPGGGLANLLTAFKDNRHRFNFIICRHETGAAYIADGYHRATCNLGVVMVTTGPGATNALTGVMNAQNDGSALLLITGEVNESYFGMGYLQEGTDAKLNINGIYAASIGYTAMVSDSSNLETIIRQALRDALSIPHNAVHISMPNNVTTEVIVKPQLLGNTSSYRSIPKGAPLDEVKKAVKSLLNAKRPVILLGNGCRNALVEQLPALEKFASRYGIPIMTTADGKGIFPESHPLSLRVYGIADCLWPYYWLSGNDAQDPYDGILVLGSSLNELATNKWLPLLIPKKGPFIQVDMDQGSIGRAFPVTQGIVGEAGAFIEDMEKLMSSFPPDKEMVKKRKSILSGIKKKYSPFAEPLQYNSNAKPLEPAALMRCLQENLPADAETKIFLDAGNCVGWGVHYLEVSSPWAIHSALAMGPMGFGVGAVLGAKFGRPDATCIGIVGDGAFLMHCGEVSTASQYNAGAIWIVLNDNNLNMVTQGQEQYFPDKKDPDIWEKLYSLGNPDIAKIAEGLGADAYTVNSTAELKKLLPKILKSANKGRKPQVIVANINRTRVPPYYNPLYS